ncbi:MAG: pseudouridine-5'-phosphate glycosidase [Chloroflexota bacterium]|nr:pseudouridine-5'-phosphate glycosidase [Chloroflexota bacterium]
MSNHLPQTYHIDQDLILAQQLGAPIVALESAVITHGLPYPENLNTARELEAAVLENGANPATIALLEGKIHIGLMGQQLEKLANLEKTRKISLRDFGIALARGQSGGTTVAATLFAATQAGIHVFATGGIGGVHRGAPFDVSADLPQLGKSPVLVVCAGAKAILDLPATHEVLETQGIPIIGFQTDEFPAFYSASSGLPVDQRVETPKEAAKIALKAWEAGLQSAVLLVVPPPAEAAMPASSMEATIQTALAEAVKQGIHGAATTPFLLSRVSALTGGESLHANLELLRKNARVAAQVAVAMRNINQPGAF